MRIQVPLACVLALTGARAANAQCYQFLSGAAASLTFNITNLPPPTISPYYYGNQYIYTLSSPGISAVLTIGSTVYVGPVPNGSFTIQITEDPMLLNSTIAMSGVLLPASVDAIPQAVIAAITISTSQSDLLPGGLPTVIPPVSQWPFTSFMAAGQTFPLTAITSSCSPPPVPPKSLGCNCQGSAWGADPIALGTGNLFEQATDYTTVGQNPLYFSRYYNSLAAGNGSFAATLGNWRSPYDRYLHITPATGQATSVLAERADGQGLAFTSNGSVWVSDSDVDYSLTQSGAAWTLTGPDDTAETYAVDSTGKGTLNSIKARNGYTQNLTYSGGLLQSVKDSYSRSLNFTYNSGLLSTLTTPDGTLNYAFNSNGALSTVTYPTSPASTLTYVYENTSFPLSLTGIIDENANRYVTWTYDTQGRGKSSKRGDTLGADLTTVTYNADGTTTVTNALGVADTYHFTMLQGVPKVVEIDRAATSTTAPATRIFGYDANGYQNLSTDWNGNQTGYDNDSHGQPTAIGEAVGTPWAQNTTITYDPVFVHLPQQIITKGAAITINYKTTTFGYEPGTGNLLTRTETDTTTQLTPYSTSGTTRTWTNGWANFLLTSVTGPRTDPTQKTQFGYDASGALTSVTDALGHVTSIIAHTGGGLPQTIVDPNGVTTTLTYDGRQRLRTSTVQPGASNLTTTYTYDAAGNLTQTTLPDGSYLANTYDNAHRPKKVTNALGEYISYTLDALGDRMAANIYNGSDTLTRQHSAKFDALGRLLNDVGGMGQTTTYAYDFNGNATAIADPLNHTAHQNFDALNRLTKITDRAGGVTQTFYDAYNRVTSIIDTNGSTTTYIRDGFGRVIQQISSDSGTSVYRYDLAGNLTQKTDGAGVVTNHTYDALNREHTRTFPAHPAENVSETWDQTTGHGFGVGHLTSMTDAVGTVNYTYDERGNDIHESRSYGVVTSNSATSYDAASRVAGIINPSGWAEAWLRDSTGQVTGIGIEAPGSTAVTLVTSSITHMPFGPVAKLTYANGVAHTATFDLDYRQMGLKDQGTATIQNLSYNYDANDNLKIITDAVNAANGQMLGFDNLDRLTDAASGAGGYGTLHWNYDANGNRSSETVNGTTTNYRYAPGTNRLTMIGTASLAYSGAGEMTTQPGSPALSFAYDQSEQLATATRAALPTALPRGRTLRPDLGSYGYDGFGRRLLKGVDVATWFTYGGPSGALTEEARTVGPTTDYVYLDPSSRAEAFFPVAEIENSTGRAGTVSHVYYVHADRIGAPQKVTDGSEAVQWSTTYLPFGGTAPTIGSITQNLRLPGQEYDGETGLYHNGFRDYVPGLGRYLESDPIGLNGGTNMYGYVSANPEKWTDRVGLLTHWGDLSVPIGGSASGANPPIVTGSPISISPQTVQDVLDWLRNLFPDIGGSTDSINTDSINSAVDTASNVGTAVTLCPGGTGQAVRHYSNAAATYDPVGDPGGWTTLPVDPDTSSWQSRFDKWFQQQQQKGVTPN